MKNIIMIVGPTAVGKTDLSLEIAKELNGEIISMDSMQIYKYMDIGTAKPTKDELEKVKHYMISEIDPKEDFSVSSYSYMAKKYINDIIDSGSVPIFVGGTGLYANSIIYNMDFSNTTENPEYRRELEEILNVKGREYLHAMLAEKDIEAAKRIHANNSKRIIRALEILNSDNSLNDFSKIKEINDEYNIILIGLNRNRKKLYARINKRVDMMLELGLIDEVKSLLKLGLTEDYRSMQGIGYKEVLMFLNGKIDFETMVSILKQNSRRYAKRQLTWFKRYSFIKWFDIDKYDGIEELKFNVLKHINDKLV